MWGISEFLEKWNEKIACVLQEPLKTPGTSKYLSMKRSILRPSPWVGCSGYRPSRNGFFRIPSLHGAPPRGRWDNSMTDPC